MTHMISTTLALMDRMMSGSDMVRTLWSSEAMNTARVVLMRTTHLYANCLTFEDTAAIRVEFGGARST